MRRGRHIGPTGAPPADVLGLAQSSDLSGISSQGCYGCHTVGATGTAIGPDLSHIGAKHNRSYLTGWLRDPSSQKPTAHMPKLTLIGAEVAALAEYLSSLR